MSILYEQFKNLFDPGTALGAFLISFIAGIATSFIGGVKCGKLMSIKKNSIDITETVEGDVSQDVHYQEDTENIIKKERKSNSIHVGNVKGNINQDCTK